MTLQNAIKRYNLIKQEKDFTGTPYPKNYICYTATKETDKAKYFYCLDSDTDFAPGLYFLTVTTVYKNTNKDYLRTYIIDN